MIIIYFFLILGVAGGLELGSLTIMQAALIEIGLLGLCVLEYKRIERRDKRIERREKKKADAGTTAQNH